MCIYLSTLIHYIVYKFDLFSGLKSEVNKTLVDYLLVYFNKVAKFSAVTDLEVLCIVSKNLEYC